MTNIGDGFGVRTEEPRCIWDNSRMSNEMDQMHEKPGRSRAEKKAGVQFGIVNW